MPLNGTDPGYLGDFAGYLTGLDAKDILLIEDIYGLDKKTCEYICKPMNDFTLYISIDSGPRARAITLNLPPFTLIGTTTKKDRIPPSLLSSFTIVEEFEPYSVVELRSITEAISSAVGMRLDSGAATRIASEGCLSPRDVLHRLTHVRDFLAGNSNSRAPITRTVIEEALEVLPPATSRLRSSRKQSINDDDVHRDPLKRRYQVFVSSTYEDLKEERRLVMQALLETKCIPTGMELFPAGNKGQWELIKRVIDDCDYYVVILGSRYGSHGPSKQSFTEMEFDYAVSSGKSIIGFYHIDPESRPQSKSSKTAKDRRSLHAFARKVKERLCKSWSTPEDLSSAIKSAILHAIEHDPKPGWIRSSDLPASFALSELKRSRT